MKNLEGLLDSLVSAGAIEHIALRVGRGDDIIYDTYRSADKRTLFDMASVTKIVAATSIALIAIDRGLLSIDDTVGRFFRVPSEKREITIRHLLTHTFGIGHKSMLPSRSTYEDIQNYILSIPLDIPIGSDVRYSCPGYILLGRIIEELFGDRLDRLFYSLVSEPLGMASSRFLPDRALDIVNANLPEEERGLVNDYNCRYLGGVAGNAGLFSNIEDMTRYAKMLLAKGAPIISRRTFDAATKNYTADFGASRGLGFLYVDGRYEQTGGLFADGAIGHCGHTGQSIFADVASGLYVIVLSDATVCTEKRYGKEKYSEVKEMRARIHAAIKSDIEN